MKKTEDREALVMNRGGAVGPNSPEIAAEDVGAMGRVAVPARWTLTAGTVAHDHMIAGLELGDSGADIFLYAGSLVAEHGREADRIHLVPADQIRVANPPTPTTRTITSSSRSSARSTSKTSNLPDFSLTTAALVFIACSYIGRRFQRAGFFQMPRSCISAIWRSMTFSLYSRCIMGARSRYRFFG